jgi:glutamate synthase (NADPH/NADH) small chain
MLCPKCRRPIDGDEPYICCATATLAWRCMDCMKVSEGFAFPYGTCPLCGGTLAVLDPRAIDDAAAVEGVRTAFEIELGGHAFYTSAARETADPALRDLFSRLAVMEEEHMATLSRRYHADIPAPSDDFRIEQAAIYAGIDHHPEDPGNLFRIAIAFENRAASFFTERSADAPEGSAEQMLYRELAAEENEHVVLLRTEYECWKAGRTGVL